LFGLLACFTLTAYGQAKTKVRVVERTDADTVVIRQGDTVIYVKERLSVEDSIRYQGRRFNVQVAPDGVLITKNEEAKNKRLVTRVMLLDVGFAGFLYEGSLNMPPELEYLDLRGGGSRNVNLQLFTQRVRFAQNHMNFSYGLMFEFNKYRLQNDIRLIEGSNPLMWEDAGKELRKNKFKAAYLYIPIMFGVESKPERFMKSFRARAGMYAGVLTSSKQKLVAEITDREKNKDDFNLNRFRYGIRGEMGYGLVNFYVHYSLAPMFKDGQGPDLQPINFGIMLLPF
jgi:hypothetical protein